MYCTTKEEIQEEIDELKEEIEAYENHEKEDIFNEFLDDVHGDITIGELTYSASVVLKNVDEIAYNEAYNNWADEEINQLQEKIDDFEDELKGCEE